MRITLGLFGFEVFSLAINDPNEAAYAAGVQLDSAEEPDDDTEDDDTEPDEESWQGGMHFYGSVESTVVAANPGSQWDDPGWRYNLDSPWEEANRRPPGRRAGFR